MSLEGLKQIFEIGGVILLFLTFIFGAGALYTASRLNVEKDAQLRQFDKDLTDNKGRVAGLEQDVVNAKAEMARQQTRAATAEKALLELQQRLAHRRISKSDHVKFVAALLPYRGSSVALTKLLTDSEAATFADDIIAVLTEAKWNINLSIKGQTVPPQYDLT